MTRKAMIQFADVSYKYPRDERWVLKDVSFCIEKGRFVGIIGKNGSGKSTLARMCNGLLLPVRGQVLVDGMDTRNVHHLHHIRRKVGLLLPNPDNQIVAGIVEDDIAFGPGNLGLPSGEIQKRVNEALRLVEMEEFKKHPPYLLSGGQKQRIALAGLLALKPDYLVLDEPTSMLDPEGRYEVARVLQRINREAGVTLIWITHNLEEIIHADQIIILESGKAVEPQNARELFLQTEPWEKAGVEPLSYARMAGLLGLDVSALEVQDFTAKELVNYLWPLRWKK